MRFFNVMIPTMLPFAARSIGKTLMEFPATKSQNGFRSHRQEVPLRDKRDPCNTVAMTMAGRGSSSPIARNKSVINL